MTATISTFDNTTKRASNAAQTNSLGASRRSESSADDYNPNESASNACARLQRENFSVLERVLAIR